jgi:hypothetical protein
MVTDVWTMIGIQYIKNTLIYPAKKMTHSKVKTQEFLYTTRKYKGDWRYRSMLSYLSYTLDRV